MAKGLDILKNAVMLFIITAVVAALLAGANILTRDQIAENARIAEQNALQEVLEAESFEPSATQALVLVDFAQPVTGAYFAKNGDEVVGFCVKVATTGYGGKIELMFGVDTSMTITGVSVLSHAETAGLGANVTKPEFRELFVGKKEIGKVVKSGAKDNEIQALSGATISSEAVAEGAKTALAAAQWLANTPGLDTAKEAVQE